MYGSMGLGRLGLMGIAAASIAALGPGVLQREVPVVPRKISWRDNDTRALYRSGRSYPDGLNGNRAVARRLRQIEAVEYGGYGSPWAGATLHAANGLVSL